MRRKLNHSRRTACVVLFTAFILQGYAQIEPVIPYSTAPGNATVAILDNWSGFQNLPALAHIQNLEVSARYENRFMINELSTRSVQIGKKNPHANLGASFSYRGYSTYNEILSGIGIARNFDNKFSMGMQFNYLAVYFHNEEESHYRGALLAQFGVTSNITPKLTVGFHTFNPFQTAVKAEIVSKRISSIFSIGTGYRFTDKIMWLTQLDKEVSSNYRIATGVDYRMVQDFSINIGLYKEEFLTPTLGFGVHFDHLTFYLNTEIHPILGLSSAGQLKYRF